MGASKPACFQASARVYAETDKKGLEPGDVINNKRPDGDGVINSGKSRVPRQFAAWAADFVALQRERLRIRGEKGAGLDRWWAGLPEALRLFLLSLVDPGDWRRYECTPWRGLPAAMRDAILIEARCIGRHCRGLGCL